MKPVLFLVLTLQADDIEKPLIPHDLNVATDPRNDLARISSLEGSGVQIEGGFSSPRTHGLVCEQRVASTDVQSRQCKPVFYYINWCTVYVIIY